ncbi:ABC transporter ATP-binding protein [Flavihumibacter sp. CACIAM 22H1]|uniref:ABC transporter ATP-binding protein n=1 Tax=Flavihumibacter sp. CACIAM 22H1 TaxID=1812911 RepID=UPI0007A8678E|nr:ABC transporter ATP-binding protein [Flavihumibacter sp. CACIAM 22H1]KYP14127.1 MAG: multidrug ABC transporter ATP-binding protein [Flavihumibacter sp. CACIAM 22H1]
MKLSIKNLSKTYANGVQAIRDLSLELSEGMFGLLGPNGAGKSSLMRTIATLQPADSGSIYLDQLNVLEDKSELRQALGYLPQEFGVYPRISAAAMLDHIARLKGILDRHERREAIHYLLHKVNLLAEKDKLLGSFSGGMKQRFGIAQALLGAPRLIIVDEPTAGLDPAERNRFYNLLSDIGENTIVLLSTHIVEDVYSLCARFAIISAGTLLYTGTPKEATESLQNKLFQTTITRSQLPQLQQTFNIVSTQLKEGRLLVRIYSEEDTAPGFEPVEPNLEDVYFIRIQQQG